MTLPENTLEFCRKMHLVPVRGTNTSGNDGWWLHVEPGYPTPPMNGTFVTEQTKLQDASRLVELRPLKDKS